MNTVDRLIRVKPLNNEDLKNMLILKESLAKYPSAGVDLEK